MLARKPSIEQRVAEVMKPLKAILEGMAAENAALFRDVANQANEVIASFADVEKKIAELERWSAAIDSRLARLEAGLAGAAKFPGRDAQ